MKYSTLKTLPIGTALHVERPGPCRKVTIADHLEHAKGVGVAGSPRPYYLGDAVVLLHLPDDCPFREAAIVQ